MNKIVWMFLFIFFAARVLGQSNLTCYEYWFNDDYANLQSVAIDPATNHQFTDDINVGHLPDGLNRFTLRYKDENGFYSSTYTNVFLKHTLEKLKDYEYWFNNDYPNKQVIAFTPDSQHQISGDIDVSHLPSGINILNLRYKGNNGLYSSTQSKVFLNLPVNEQLTHYEYWMNNNFEAKINVAITPAAQHELINEIDVSELVEGLNLITIRYMASTGIYSSAITKFFYKNNGAVQEGKKVTTWEYWFNNDYTNRVETAFTPAIKQEFIASIDATTLSEGLNVFNIRFKDEKGIYSTTLTEVFYKNPHAGVSSNKIYAYRYRIEDEGGVAQGGDPLTGYTLVNLLEPISPALIDLDIDMAQIPQGNYSIVFAALDSLGLWSVTTTDLFEKTAFPIAHFEPVNEHFCSGNSIQFKNLSFDANQFSWDFGDGNTSDSFEPEHIYTVAGDYEVSLTATDTGTGRDSTVSQIIVIHPEYDIEARKAICLDSTYQFGSQLITEAGVYNELFQSVTGCDSLVNLTVQTVNGNTEIDNISPNDDCFNGFYTITVAGNGYLVLVEPGATVDFIAGNTIRFMPGFHAKNSSYVNAYITTEPWFCESQLQPIIAAQPPVEKSIELEDVFKKKPSVGKEYSILVYPNPNKGHFKLALSGFENKPDLTVFSIEGKVVFHKTQVESDFIEIALPALRAGIYSIHVNDGKTTRSVKMIVE